MSDGRHKSNKWLWRQMEDDEPITTTLATAENTLDELESGAKLTTAALQTPSRDHQIRERGFAGGLVQRPHMDALLSAGYAAIYREIEKLMEKSAREKDPLTATETKQLESYLKLIRTLGMEERDQREADKFGEMTEKQLRAIVNGEVTDE